VVDLGCGAGHLGIAALLAWPEATAVLADGDHRAVASVAANLGRLGLSTRAEARWWDAAEELVGGPYDLALINPPAHEGAAVSLGPAQAMLRSLRPALARDGRIALVANRRLPYERELAAFGACRLAQERDGFKILVVSG
jgi:16S rRNA (guanine1207-N2)-methyltransferase